MGSWLRVVAGFVVNALLGLYIVASAAEMKRASLSTQSRTIRLYQTKKLLLISVRVYIPRSVHIAQIVRIGSGCAQLALTRKPQPLATSALRLGMGVAFGARRLTRKQTHLVFAEGVTV